MAIPKKVLKLVQLRDDHCWHCGLEDDLVPHHRMNRGMGGSKLLDTPDNLMMVCGLYNFEMESDNVVAAAARGWGHKLSVWESTDHLVFDCVRFEWWLLDGFGGKVLTPLEDNIF